MSKNLKRIASEISKVAGKKLNLYTRNLIHSACDEIADDIGGVRNSPTYGNLIREVEAAFEKYRDDALEPAKD